MEGAGKIALVTGANKGIGYEIVRGLAQKGCIVLLGARNAALGQAAAKDLQAEGKIQFLELDVTSDSSVDKATAYVKQQFGHLDILVNNAGVGNIPGGALDTTDPKEVAWVFEVNVFGVVRMLNAFLPLIKAAPAGRIVNASSVVGSFGLVDQWGAVRKTCMAYAASKSTLNGIMQSYAMNLEEGSPVKINNICPGYCSTDLNNFEGHHTAEQGAQISIKMALIGPEGPCGELWNDAGKQPW
ncbi:hypothetical protein WJX73_002739 [Symbiochloris irregularis]|uniref:Uncharacterized protein n=1 Tax=Symbiochloris irregularis TaxID=706552 RepID=A0AAW1NR43_9CHLO